VSAAPFGTRLAEAFARYGQLCVGIDPHPYLLAEWGLPVSAEGARDFGLRVLDAASGLAPVVKPQVAFFERYGSAGFRALEDVLARARETDLLVIADAKRGDIGTTMDSYAAGWFSDDSPLRADAVTVAAYQGLGANAGFIAKARETDSGVFVLAATSNPEAKATQTAILATGATVAKGIVDDVLLENSAADQGASRAGEPGLGSVGLVLGATLDLADYGIDLSRLVSTPILAPGFGAQGARYGDVRRLYGPASGAVLVSASRSLVAGGPSSVAEAIRTASGEVTACLA
jgi:orotidine-5'-phosphate decarboxylase